jgi:hypothetical protein
MIRISRNAEAAIMSVELFEEAISIGVGISKTISISNTMKIIARRKNRIENGIRALWFGSNPHSNGDDFSRSFMVRMASSVESR